MLRRGTKLNRDQWTAIIIIIPSIILLAIFVYGFIAWTAALSLTDATTVKMARGEVQFIGFKNYTDLFTGLLNKRFRVDLINTIFFTVMFIVICLGVGLLLAMLLDQHVKGEAIFRTIFLFPMALSFIVTGIIWKWLFNPTQGLNALPTLIGQPPGTFRWFISQDQWWLFNWQDLPTILSTLILIILGLIILLALWRWNRSGGRSQLPGYLIGLAILLGVLITLQVPQQLSTVARPETHGFNVALIAVVVAAGWQMSGYTMAMYLAGLRGIPEELREAAQVDGATELGVYRHVILPLLQPITLSAVIVLGHISLKIFDLVYAMGGGDNPFIDMPGINMFFTTFRGNAQARGAAIAIIMLLMVAVVIVPYLRSSLKSES